MTIIQAIKKQEKLIKKIKEEIEKSTQKGEVFDLGIELTNAQDRLNELYNDLQKTDEELNRINNQIEQLNHKLTDIEHGNTTKEFDDFLDETYEPYKLPYPSGGKSGELTFFPADILKLDKVMYKDELNNYNDLLVQDIETDISELVNKREKIQQKRGVDTNDMQ